MNTRGHVFRAASGLILLLPLARTAVAQQSLFDAKGLYFTASYEQSLALLNQLKEGGTQPEADAVEIEEYRAFCLLALGHSTEAEHIFEEIVSTEPLHQLDANIAPHLRATFRDVRQRSLPTVVQQAYRTARATFERGDPAAVSQFERVIAILNDRDMENADKSMVEDLRTLASGFLQLSAAAVKPSPKPTVEQAVPTVEQAVPTVEPARPKVEPGRPSSVAELTRIYASSDAGVIPPVTLRQELPRWPPVALLPMGSRCVLELVIDERGKVESSTIRQSVHSLYDALLLDAAKTWQYRAALKDGKPVKFRKLLQISLDAQGGK